MWGAQRPPWLAVASAKAARAGDGALGIASFIRSARAGVPMTRMTAARNFLSARMAADIVAPNEPP